MKFYYPAIVHLTIGDDDEGVAVVEQHAKWMFHRPRPNGLFGIEL